MDFEKLFSKANTEKRLAVAAAEDDHVLQAAESAVKIGFKPAVLFGNTKKIAAAAEKGGVDISSFEIVHCETPLEAAAAAVTHVREKKAEVLVKGLIQTPDLLRVVLNKENGLRTGALLSHVASVAVPALDRELICTDGGMIMYPDLKTKIELIKNAVAVARSLGIDNPKVAVLAAVEVCNADMQCTMDAAVLTVMSKRGQIKGCVVDGPMAMDCALSRHASELKGITGEVGGNADILLFPNIEAANCSVKVMSNLAGCLFGGIITGASVPIVLTSRSDSAQSKLYAISVASRI